MARFTTLGWLLAAGLMAACTPTTWSRPGVDDAALAADQAECRSIAVRQARHLAFRHGLLYPPRLFRWRHGRFVFDDDPFDRRFADETFLRRRLERDCLIAKGYRRVPVAPQS